MIHRFGTALIALGTILIVACNSNPPLATEEEHDDELTVELSFTPDHVHILQSEVTFTVAVTDHHGEAVTDFDTIRVERRQQGSDTWRGIDLSLAGSSYQGTYVFSSSGDYDLRVVGQRPGETEMAVLHTVAEPIHCARAHAEAGGVRVEFESFPGHIHEGDAATLRYWVMEQEEDPTTGVREPIGGMTMQVHVQESTGDEQLYDAMETETGVYEYEHTFLAAEEAHVGMHFMGTGGQPAEAAFEVHVAHAH